jgi:hypothetical protein
VIKIKVKQDGVDTSLEAGDTIEVMIGGKKVKVAR